MPMERGAYYPFLPFLSKDSHNIRLGRLIIQTKVTFILLLATKAQTESIGEALFFL